MSEIVRCLSCGAEVLFPEDATDEGDGEFLCKAGGPCNQVRRVRDRLMTALGLQFGHDDDES